MSTKLERSAKRSMRAVADLNDDVNVRKMTDYYIVVDQGKCELSPITKAMIDIENKKAAGQFDELNQPLKSTYKPDPEIIKIQAEIEKLVKKQTAA